MFKLTALLTAFLALPLWLMGLNVFEEVKTFKISAGDCNVYRLDNLSLKKVNQKMVFAADEVTEKTPKSLDLFLDFEGPLENLYNYKIINAYYMQNGYQYVNGKYSAKFYLSDHYISLLPLATSILSPGNVCGSFTIEFWTYFYKNYDNQYVMRYIGNNLSDEIDKYGYGISIFTRNNRLIYQFDNLFWSANNESASRTITEDENFTLNKWEHHAVTYNIMNGKLTTYKNGVEQQVIWVTSDGKALSPIFNPYVKDELSTPILLGRNGVFSMDNFKISRACLTGFNLKRYSNRESVLVTDVYQVSQNLMTMKKLSLECSSPEYYYVKMGYRISDRYFKPDNSDLAWVYVQNGVTEFPQEHLKGKYVQFKVTVYPYEEMDSLFTINSISMDYTGDASPDAPILLGADPCDGGAGITWMPVPEDDVAGYEIYYGNRSGDYICRDCAGGESPIFVTNGLKGKMAPMRFMLEGLANERPYFISLRAIDVNGHRSPYSKELYVRPSSVYNDKKYSVDR